MHRPSIGRSGSRKSMSRNTNFRKTSLRTMSPNTEIYRVGDYQAVYVGNSNECCKRLVCEVCGLELRSGIYAIPDYQQSLLQPVDQVSDDFMAFAQCRRHEGITVTHPFRDLLINTRKNIENVTKLLGGSSVEQEMGKQLILLLLATDRNVERCFWQETQDFEMGVVHAVKLYMAEFHQLFNPMRHNDEVIIAFAKAKVLEAMQQHLMLREAFPELRHAYRANEIRARIHDVVCDCLTGEERQQRIEPIALKLVDDVINRNVAIQRSSEVIACAIVCAVCVLAKVPAPCKEMLARNYNIVAGVILGVQHEIETTLIKDNYKTDVIEGRLSLVR